MASDKERVKSYDGQAKRIYFLIGDYEILKKYNNIWYKVRADIKKELNSDPVYNGTFFKAKIKSYGDEPTDLNDRDKHKSHFSHSNHYWFYSQKNMKTFIHRHFLKNKSTSKKKKVIRHITQGVEISFQSGEEFTHN